MNASSSVSCAVGRGRARAPCFNVSIMDGLMDLDDAHGTDHLSFCHGEEDLPQDDTESDSDDDLGLFNYLRHGGA